MDETPAHVALREALANLLVHADYAEPQASLVTRSANGYFFRNPGSSRVPESDLLTGDRSDPRNPLLRRMVGAMLLLRYTVNVRILLVNPSLEIKAPPRRTSLLWALQ